MKLKQFRKIDFYLFQKSDWILSWWKLLNVRFRIWNLLINFWICRLFLINRLTAEIYFFQKNVFLFNFFKNFFFSKYFRTDSKSDRKKESRTKKKKHQSHFWKKFVNSNSKFFFQFNQKKAVRNPKIKITKNIEINNKKEIYSKST